MNGSPLPPVLYDMAAALALTAWSPILAYKAMTREKYRQGFPQRLGRIASEVVDRFKDKPFIWVHACSVGETQAGVPIVSHLREMLPDHGILVSTVTDTGNRLARDKGLGDEVIYLPLDFFHIWTRILDVLRPSAFVILETEIWPAMIATLKSRGIPVAVLNGRISDRAFRRYQPMAWFFRPVMASVDLVAAQSELDAERFRTLGALSGRVEMLGNAKYDAVAADVSEEEKGTFRKGLNLAEDEVVWIAGSTFPGEERLIGSVYAQLKPRWKQLRLLVAPRHPERFDEAERDLRALGLSVTRKTSGRTPDRDGVILLDTVGELSRLYSIAHVAVIGKSLLASGGQNPLEASAQGCAVIHGPNMENFRDATRLLSDAGASVIVSDADSLSRELERLIADAELRRERGRRARAVVEACRGASKRMAERVAGLIKQSHETALRQ